MKKKSFYICLLIMMICFTGSYYFSKRKVVISISHYAMGPKKEVTIDGSNQYFFLKKTLETLNTSDIANEEDNPDNMDGIGLCEFVFYHHGLEKDRYQFDYGMFHFVKHNDSPWKQIVGEDCLKIHEIIRDYLKE